VDDHALRGCGEALIVDVHAPTSQLAAPVCSGCIVSHQRWRRRGGGPSFGARRPSQPLGPSLDLSRRTPGRRRPSVRDPGVTRGQAAGAGATRTTAAPSGSHINGFVNIAT